MYFNPILWKETNGQGIVIHVVPAITSTLLDLILFAKCATYNFYMDGWMDGGCFFYIECKSKNESMMYAIPCVWLGIRGIYINLSITKVNMQQAILWHHRVLVCFLKDFSF